MHVYMYMCMYEYMWIMCHDVCRGQRTAYESQFWPTMWDMGIVLIWVLLLWRDTTTMATLKKEKI